MAYFVVFEHVRLDHEPLKSNIILRRTHPVVWAANPPAVYLEGGMSTRLLFWAEIPDDVAEQVKGWCGIEE